MQYTLHLTDACNLRCRYCGQRRSDAPGGRMMSRETAIAAVDMALAEPDASVGIGFYGGEPLLCGDLIRELVAYIKRRRGDKRVFCKLTTNGLLLDDAFADFAAREGVWVSLSVDGDALSHDANRVDAAGRGSYARVTDAAARLLARQPHAAAMMTLSPNTAHRLYDAVTHLYALGFTHIICTPDYGGGWEANDLRALAAEYERLAGFYYDRMMAEESLFFSPFDAKINSHIHRGSYAAERCRLGYEQLSVAPDGGLYPCVQFVGEGAFRVGDVFGGVDEPRRRAIYDASRKPQPVCRTCALRGRCLHTCACVNRSTTGDLTQPSPLLCAHERLLIPIADRVAARLYKARCGAFLHKQYNAFYPLISLVEERSSTKEASSCN